MSVRLSVRHNPYCTKRLNVGSRKQRHTIARILVFWCQRLRRSSNGVTPNWGAKQTWGKLRSAIFDQYFANRYISETVQDRYIATDLLWKSNRKSYALYRIVLFSVIFVYSVKLCLTTTCWWIKIIRTGKRLGYCKQPQNLAVVCTAAVHGSFVAVTAVLFSFLSIICWWNKVVQKWSTVLRSELNSLTHI